MARRLDAARERKCNLLDLLIKKVLPESDFADHNEELTREIAEIEAAQARADESIIDPEGVLDYAEFLLNNAGTIWLTVPLDQQQRLQRALYPNGVIFTDGKFGTNECAFPFKQLDVFGDGRFLLASPTGFEPVSQP